MFSLVATTDEQSLAAGDLRPIEVDALHSKSSPAEWRVSRTCVLLLGALGENPLS
jgi:hypothetical protein